MESEVQWSFAWKRIPPPIKQVIILVVVFWFSDPLGIHLKHTKRWWFQMSRSLEPVNWRFPRHWSLRLMTSLNKGGKKNGRTQSKGSHKAIRGRNVVRHCANEYQTYRVDVQKTIQCLHEKHLQIKYKNCLCMHVLKDLQSFPWIPKKYQKLCVCV